MKTPKQVEDTSLFDKIVAETPKETSNFIDHSLEIAHQIELLMEQKGMLQKDLAKAMDKTEAEISKWLCGFHNFTIKTISKIEAVLEAKIITTPYSIEVETLELANSINVMATTGYKSGSRPNKWTETEVGEYSFAMAA